MVSAVDFGHLLLPKAAPASPEPLFRWVEEGANVALVALALILFIVCLSELLQIIPTLTVSLQHRRGSVEIEHSLNTARRRNLVAFCLFPSFIALVLRFEVWHPGFIADLGPWMKNLTCSGFFAAMLLWRRIVAKFCFGSKLGDEEKAALRGLYSLFILITIVSLPTCGILTVFGAGDKVIRIILRVFLGVLLVVNIIRTKENLSFRYGGLSTILYLCALEIIPAVILIWTASCA